MSITRSLAQLACAAVTLVALAPASRAGQFDDIDASKLADARSTLQKAVTQQDFKWSDVCQNWKPTEGGHLPGGLNKVACVLPTPIGASKPRFVVLFNMKTEDENPKSSRARMVAEVENIRRISLAGLNVVPTDTEVLVLPHMDARTGVTDPSKQVYGYVQAFMDFSSFYLWHYVVYESSSNDIHNSLANFNADNEAWARDPRPLGNFCGQILQYWQTLDWFLVVDEQGAVDKETGDIYFNDPFATYAFQGPPPRLFDPRAWQISPDEDWAKSKKPFGMPIQQRKEQWNGLARIYLRSCLKYPVGN